MLIDSPIISGSLISKGNVTITGSLNVTGPIVGALTGSVNSSSFAATASSADNFTVRGTLTAQTIVSQVVTSSVLYSSGSNIFGNSASNVQAMTGSLQVSGSGTFASSVSATGLFGYILRGRSSDNYGAFGFYSNDGGTRYGYIQSHSTNGGQLNITADGGGQLIMDNRGSIFSNTVSSATNFRLNNQSYSQVAILDGGGGFAGGYNFNINAGTAQHDSTGAATGYWYKSDGSVNFYSNTSAASGTSLTPRFTIGASGASTFSSSVTANGLYANAGSEIRIYRPANDVYWRFNNDANNFLNIGNYFANGTSVGTNPKVVLRDDNGSVGIGVTPSAWSLSGLSAMQIQNGGFYGYSVDEVGVTSNAYFNSGWKYINNSFATQYSTFNGSHRWYTAPSGTAGNAISFTQAMTLDASGNLGIGNTLPSTFNQRVNAPHLVIGAGSNSPGLTLYSGTANQSSINFAIGTTTTQQYDGGLIYVPNSGSPYLSFHVSGGSERMRITSGGNVLIGAISLIGAKLESKTTGDGTAFSSSFLGYDNSAYGNTFVISHKNGESRLLSSYVGGSAINSDMTFWTTQSNGSQGERMRITSGGNVLIGQTVASGTSNGIYFRPGIESGFIVTNDIAIQLGRLGSTGDIQSFYSGSTRVGTISVSSSNTSYNTSSDYRLKEDLKDYNGLDIVSKIKTYDFAWKNDKTRNYGVIAHEISEIIPYVVMGEKDGEFYQGVDYSKIVPILVKAIQELKAEIDQLKSAK